MTIDELEGNTLSVYAYIVRVGTPVGTREVTRGAELAVLVWLIIIFRNLKLWV